MKKITKFDIGAEVISILTKGMYPDPRDAIREYIQNALDANSKNLDVKVRQNSVVIEDDGEGMDYNILRKALRVGVSDKTPGKDVGFMGIGIYSSFHLCDTLTIYSRKKGNLPQMVEMDFKGMRDILLEQKEKRLLNEIKSENLIDLQSLLDKFIKLPDENSLSEDEYPVEISGTRVELVGLNPILDDLINSFDDLSSYLQDVIPLHFDKDKFKWAEKIEKEISDVCQKHNSNFELINLKLQVGSQTKNLFRLYTDNDFNEKNPRFPKIIEIKDHDNFYGVAWGCLNTYDTSPGKKQNRIANKELRGFLLRKQGFAIGKRENLAKYFDSTKSHFDRYTGEIIVTNNNILPSASRSDLEISSLRTKLYYIIQEEIAVQFINESDKYQEEEKAKDTLREKGNSLKKILADYNPNEDNYNTYLKQVGEIDQLSNEITKKLKKLKDDDKKEAKNLLESSNKIKKEIVSKFENLADKKTKKTNIKQTKKGNTNIEI